MYDVSYTSFKIHMSHMAQVQFGSHSFNLLLFLCSFYVNRSYRSVYVFFYKSGHFLQPIVYTGMYLPLYKSTRV